VHGAGGSADDLYDSTSLRAKAPDFDLVGGGTRTGFFIAADQGRNIPNPNGDLGAAPRHDIYFRDFGSPSQNADFRAIDHIIDTTASASGGAVDPARIYLVGWSNGAFFASTYAIARFTTPTPGGYKVAGAAVFAGADPFDDPLASEDGECSYRPYPQAPTAIYVIHRACDSAVACDAAQNQQFSNPPGYDVTQWAATLGSSVGATVQEVILASDGSPAEECDDDFSLCTNAVGLLNHVSWPDGLSLSDEKYRNDWEGTAVGDTPGMLGFLGAHPHP
jgi:predicted esterase